MMSKGFCLLYRFGDEVNLNRYLTGLDELGMSAQSPKSENELLQQFDINTKSYRKVELSTVEDQFYTSTFGVQISS